MIDTSTLGKGGGRGFGRGEGSRDGVRSRMMEVEGQLVGKSASC